MKDKHITISKEAATTLGLNQSVLLEALYSLLDKNKDLSIDFESILQETPFWSKDELNKTIDSLVVKGVIVKEKNKNSFYLVNKSKIKKKEISEYTDFTTPDEIFLEEEWKPNKQILNQALEYGIPEGFVMNQIQDFKHFYNEKHEKSRSWEIKFLRFVIKQWRLEEITEYKEAKRKPIKKNWTPDQEAIEILIKAGVKKEFINEEVDEFKLYWSEKGEVSDTWNSKFIAHARRQWAKFSNLIENSDKPLPITDDWTPSEDFFQVLSLTGITKDFSESCIPEFILYWKETGQSHNSWNSKFLQHVKFQWQKNMKYSEQNISLLEERIEKSWDISEVNDPSSKTINKKSQEEVSLKLKELKKKHQI